MGSFFSKIWQLLLPNEEMRIVMLGLDAAGKTTILYKLKLGDVIRTIPTIGFNVEEVKYQKVTFTIWDINGQPKMRDLWQHYYKNTDAIVFVVDSLDRERIGEAAEVLHKMLANEMLRDASLLVLANKQDLSNAMTVSEVVYNLGLHSLRGRSWFAQATCAITGDGIYEGLDWLRSILPKRSNNIFN